MSEDLHEMTAAQQAKLAKRFGADADMAIRLTKNILTQWLRPTYGCGETGYGSFVRNNRHWLDAERDRRTKKGVYCAVGGNDKWAALFAIDATDTIGEVRRVAALLAEYHDECERRRGGGNKAATETAPEAATESATESESEAAK